MRGTYLAQQGHTVNVIPPVDFTGGKTGAWVSLKDAEHVTFILQFGVQAAAVTAILVKAAKDASGTSATAIPFNIFKQETTAGDVLGSRVPLAATGLTTPSGNASIFYVIELDAAEVFAAVGEGFPYVTVNVTNGVNSVIGSCVAVLTGLRYAGDKNITAIV